MCQNWSTNPNMPRQYPQQQKKERVAAASERLSHAETSGTTTLQPPKDLRNLHQNLQNQQTPIPKPIPKKKKPIPKPTSEPIPEPTHRNPRTRNLPSQNPHWNLRNISEPARNPHWKHRTFVWAETPKLTSNGRWGKIPFKICKTQRNMAASPAARRPPPWTSASAPGAPLAPTPEALAAWGRRWWAESSRPGRTWIPQGFHGALWVIGSQTNYIAAIGKDTIQKWSWHQSGITSTKLFPEVKYPNGWFAKPLVWLLRLRSWRWKLATTSSLG